MIRLYKALLLTVDDLELTLINASVITIDVTALAVDTTLGLNDGMLKGCIKWYRFSLQ